MAQIKQAGRALWCGLFRAKVRAVQALSQCIPRAAHGAQGIFAAEGAERFAQTTDMDIDGAGVDVDVTAPDAIKRL